MKKIILTVSAIFLLMSLSAQDTIVDHIINDVRIDSLTKVVGELTGKTQITVNGNPEIIYSRNSYSPGNEIAFQYIKQKLISYGLQTDSSVFTGNGKNIWAVLPGTLHPNVKCIIGSHYDDLPEYPNHIKAPGADDNASGVAAVIEAARIFSHYSFDNTIIFALWDKEELGMVGSSNWAHNACTNNDTILSYINLDMLGWDGNNDNVAMIQTNPIAQSVQLANTSLQCNSTYNIGLDSIIFLNQGYYSSDQASFWITGFSAISINEDYDNDLNIFLHSEADSLFQFNLPYYEKVTKLAYATLATVAFSQQQSDIIFNELNSLKEISIFPNPSTGKFRIINFNVQTGNYYIEIYNILGITTYAGLMKEKIEVIDLSFQPKGMYFVKISSEEKFYLRRIIIQ